jgi:XTP/dITP diphosphohydrolase
MKGASNRKARFRTIISLIMDGKEHFFEGIVNGRIAQYKQGSMGFGYDPVFIPNGYRKSFAEMELAEKNALSHRGIAARNLCEFLLRV